VAKGGNFEREVAKTLSLWWTEGKREDIFYRSHASGGRFTMRRKSGKDTALQGGDITASDPIGEPLIKRWSIECKTGYGKKTDKGIVRWDLLDLLDSQQREIVLKKMWAQCERDAKLTNREPILIFRRNGRKPCIMLRWVVWADLIKAHTTLNQILFDGFLIMTLSNFLETVSPNKLRKINKRIIKKRICKA